MSIKYMDNKIHATGLYLEPNYLMMFLSALLVFIIILLTRYLFYLLIFLFSYRTFDSYDINKY